ncbi:MAG: hypothetical protein OXM55_08345 [Bdellovibrionales bacterium]|nr:hypothetical protein [Bdellovibrionales bacterium]
MQSFWYLFFLSIFLLSCNGAVYFFNEDEEGKIPHLILDRNSWDIRKKKKDPVRKKHRNSLPVYQYQPPPEEEYIVLNGQVDFIPLALADRTYINLQPDTGTSFPSVTMNIGKNKNLEPLSNPKKINPISPLHVFPPAPSLHRPLEVDKTPLLFEEQKEVREPSLLLLTDGGDTGQALSIPQTPSKIAVRKSVKVFVPRPLDFFFVMDTSSSMRHHLQESVIKRKFSGFLSYFLEFDWQLIITNSNHSDNMFFLFNVGALKGKAMNLERNGTVLNFPYLHPEISGYNQIFLDSISRHRLGKYKKDIGDGFGNIDPCELPPYCEGNQEQPLRSLKSGLSKNQFREEADLVAIVISNSKERANDPASATQPEEVIEEFKKIHGEQKRFEVYGIIITEDDPNCLNENIAQQFFFPEGAISEKVIILSEITGGKVFSICSPDYQYLAQHIRDSFSKPKKE